MDATALDQTIVPDPIEAPDELEARRLRDEALAQAEAELDARLAAQDADQKERRPVALAALQLQCASLEREARRLDRLARNTRSTLKARARRARRAQQTRDDLAVHEQMVAALTERVQEDRGDAIASA